VEQPPTIMDQPTSYPQFGSQGDLSFEIGVGEQNVNTHVLADRDKVGHAELGIAPHFHPDVSMSENQPNNPTSCEQLQTIANTKQQEEEQVDSDNGSTINEDKESVAGKVTINFELYYYKILGVGPNTVLKDS
jgi:hypothetical protein